MEDKTQNIQDSINFFNNKPFETYKEWLDQNIILHKQSTLFLFFHLHNFITLHSPSLDIQRFIYLEKLFNMALELKLIQIAKMILQDFFDFFGKETKIKRMEAQLLEIEDTQRAHEFYKRLIILNQEDKTSVKRYIGLLKSSFTLSHEDLKKLIEMWNEYLKIYMDDHEAWYELSDIYLLASNYTKAVYCLEEVLLHQPNNFMIYIKLGDILSSLNNSEASVNAVKYYSQSVLIKPTPRAFWGIVAAVNVWMRCNKGKEDGGNREKFRNLVKIAKVNLENMYVKSSVKFRIEDFYDLKDL
jgi:ER membrane protein complex subunit 2